MDFESHVEELLSWYVYLAGQEGWKAHAWHRINELAKTDEMYRELPDRLVAAVKAEKQPSSSKSNTGETSPLTLPK